MWFEIPAGTGWMAAASCRLIDPAEVSFFGEHGGARLAAIAVCRGCPVRIPCAQFALDDEIDHGLWGGLTPNQRKAARAEGINADTLIDSIEEPTPQRHRAARSSHPLLAERQERLSRGV